LNLPKAFEANRLQSPFPVAQTERQAATPKSFEKNPGNVPANRKKSIKILKISARLPVSKRGFKIQKNLVLRG
jgi:hypothetical protein